MEHRQITTDNSSPASENFEFTGAAYSGTWSEAHRHDCEVTELAMMAPGEFNDQIERIKSKRGPAAATKINADTQNKRRELISLGVIKTAQPKTKPSTSYGGYRSNYNNAGSRPASAPARAPSRPSSGGPF